MVNLNAILSSTQKRYASLILGIGLNLANVLEATGFASETPNAPDQLLATSRLTPENRRTTLLYNETTYLPQLDNVVNEGKIIHQFDAWPSLRPYLGLAIGQDLKSDSSLIYNDNHVSPLSGIRYSPRDLPWGAYLEFRQNLRVIRPPTFKEFSEGDLRLGAYLYQMFYLTPPKSIPFLFQELYAELLYSSALKNNLFLQGWLKQGVRAKLHRILDLDGYFEFAGTLDRTGNPDFNLACIDLGVRVNIRLDSLLTQIVIKEPIAWLAAPPDLAFPWSSQIIISGEF